MRKPMSLALAVLLLAGCATPQPGSPRRNPNRISREEIVEAGPTTAWNLVQELRPIWLRTRGRTSFTQNSDVVVYVDGTRVGEREALRQIDSHDIESIEFLDARLATARYGTGHVHGAILVHTLG